MKTALGMTALLSLILLALSAGRLWLPRISYGQVCGQGRKAMSCYGICGCLVYLQVFA